MAKLFIVPDDVFLDELSAVVDAHDNSYIPITDSLLLLKSVLEHAVDNENAASFEDEVLERFGGSRDDIERALLGDAFLNGWCADGVTIVIYHDDGTVLVRAY